jgi:hypothetical protein
MIFYPASDYIFRLPDSAYYHQSPSLFSCSDPIYPLRRSHNPFTPLSSADIDAHQPRMLIHVLSLITLQFYHTNIHILRDSPNNNRFNRPLLVLVHISHQLRTIPQPRTTKTCNHLKLIKLVSCTPILLLN